MYFFFTDSSLIFLSLFTVVVFFGLRTLYLIVQIRNSKNKFSLTKRKLPVKTIICIGSGGHTTEMMKLIENINPKFYSPRYYIMSKTDNVSGNKISAFENTILHPNYCIIKIPRSRYVNQSYITSVFTTINSALYCIPVVMKIRPDLILCNGPGTCIPICLIAFLLRIFFICKTRIVFIESICRVQSLSLSGKILNFFADNIIVQWEELTTVCKRADYLGQLF